MNLDLIRDHMGEALAKYVANKHRGGTSGKKGSRYEDMFLAFKVAEILAAAVNDPPQPWPEVACQMQAFVDDLGIRAQDRTSFFQCKNTEDVAWGSGPQTIASDFEHQNQLASIVNITNPATILVVRDPRLKGSLGDTIPPQIAHHTEVHFFPYCGGSSNRLVIEDEGVQNVLRALARVDEPLFDDLAGVFDSVLSSCTSLLFEEGTAWLSVADITDHLSRRSPSLIRPFPSIADWKALADPAFLELLANIQHLRYDAPRGFFQWAAFGTSGVFSFPCSSPEFKRFQDTVIAQKPRTFEELEPFLICRPA